MSSSTYHPKHLSRPVLYACVSYLQPCKAFSNADLPPTRLQYKSALSTEEKTVGFKLLVMTVWAGVTIPELDH